MNFIKIDFNKRIILFCNENVLDKKGAINLDGVR